MISEQSTTSPSENLHQGIVNSLGQGLMGIAGRFAGKVGGLASDANTLFQAGVAMSTSLISQRLPTEKMVQLYEKVEANEFGALFLDLADDIVYGIRNYGVQGDKAIRTPEEVMKERKDLLTATLYLMAGSTAFLTVTSFAAAIHNAKYW